MMYNYVTKIEEFGPFIQALQDAEEIYLDTETTGLDFFVDRVILIQTKLAGKTFVFDTRKLGEKYSHYLVELLVESKKLLIGHNIKFDVKMIYTSYGELLTNVYDTMLAETMLKNGITMSKLRRTSLAQLVKKYCGIELDKSTREDFYTQQNIALQEEHLIYAALDVEYLETIYRKQLEILSEQKQLAVLELEKRLLPVICSMELEGVAIDEEVWKQLGGESYKIATELKKELVPEFVNKALDTHKFENALEAAKFLKIRVTRKRDQKALEQITEPDFVKNYMMENFNLDSSDQVQKVLQDVYGINIDSTNEKIINKYIDDYPVIKKILIYREHAKKVSGFGDNILDQINPTTKRLHTEFDQLGNRSGRISSSEPNLQNIPKDSVYRNAFIARPKKVIIAVDFSQEELRLLAKFARVKKMIESFRNKEDLHVTTAKGLYKIDEINKEQRNRGKSLNFAVGYGSTEWGLYKNFDIPMEEGTELLRTFYVDLYPEINLAKSAVQEKIIELGYSITMLGRRRYFEFPKVFENKQARNKFVAAITREGFNHIIQGTGAEIIKESLCRIFEENPFGDKLKILLQVYDEIVCEADEDIAEQASKFIQSIMIETESKYLLDVIPAEVEAKTGKVWLH